MALPSENIHLMSAWRALSGQSRGAGWSVIELFRSGACAVMAGRRGAGNEESLLVGIANAPVLSESSLPRGQGFTFVATDLPGDSSLSWYALVRQEGGQLPLFSLMAADLVSMLGGSGDTTGTRVISSLIARIRAWQDFMRRDRAGVLSPEEELGLIGELAVLADISEGLLLWSDAVEAWVGPEDGLHDFVVGGGAIEVKCTAAPVGFVANVFGLGQLDAALHQPLYVAAVRASAGSTGRSLPEHVDETLHLAKDEAVRARLSAKLLSAGYVESMRESYTRRFSIDSIEYRVVDETSPVLTRSNVPAAVHDVKYSLDVDALPHAGSAFRCILKTFGL